MNLQQMIRELREEAALVEAAIRAFEKLATGEERRARLEFRSKLLARSPAATARAALNSHVG
jgi:hypothetical protein